MNVNQRASFDGSVDVATGVIGLLLIVKEQKEKIETPVRITTRRGQVSDLTLSCVRQKAMLTNDERLP